MNFLNVFEERVGSLFGATAQGLVMPFSFKKLAKQAARQMESETYVINGTDTAPALYTILVSSEDDRLMRPLYPQLTLETAQFIEGQAQAKGYVFVGQPLVRFIADPSLRSGRFSVFAENIDANALERLREEERQFLGAASGTGGLGGAAADFQQAAAAAANPVVAAPVAPVNQVVVPVGAIPATPANSLTASRDAGLDVLPQSMLDVDDDLAGAADVAGMAGTGAVAGVASAVGANAAINSVPSIDQVPAQTQGVAQNINPQTIRAAQPAPAPSAAPITCLLIDRSSGQTYTAKAPRTIIGRERNAGGILLRDPNVSRSHAELSFDGRTWRIRDLNSTNGTLVNDIDIDECILRDGDLLTFGLTNLEFREN